MGVRAHRCRWAEEWDCSSPPRPGPTRQLPAGLPTLNAGKCILHFKIFERFTSVLLHEIEDAGYDAKVRRQREWKSASVILDRLRPAVKYFAVFSVLYFQHRGREPWTPPYDRADVRTAIPGQPAAYDVDAKLGQAEKSADVP